MFLIGLERYLVLLNQMVQCVHITCVKIQVIHLRVVSDETR